MKKLLALLAFVSLAVAEPAPTAPVDAQGQNQTWQRMYGLACQQRDQATRLAYDMQIQAQIAQSDCAMLIAKNEVLQTEIAQLKSQLALAKK